jgi:streptogramin lyase
MDPARLLATIPLPLAPDQLAVGAEGVWVLNHQESRVLHIDPQTKQVTEVPLPVGFSAWDLTVGSGAVWITGNGTDLVARLDPTTYRVTTIYSVAPHPIAQAALGFGALWTANAGGSTISRIDLAQGTVTSLRVGHQPHGVAVGAGAVWVGNHDDAAVVRLDPVTMQIQARIPVSGEPHRLAFGAGYLWVDGYHADGILQVDPVTNQLRGGLIPLGFASDVIAADEQGVWVASGPTERNNVRSPGSRQVVRLDPATQQVVERLVFTHPPAAVGLDAALWIAFQEPPTLLRIRR